MFRVLIACLLSTAAFAFTAQRPVQNSVALFAKSKALPFLEQPKKLDGSIVGDFGFDPLGFTETLNDMNYVRAAEIKHGRVAMLATVGFVLTQYIHILTPESDPIKAISALGLGVNLQVLFGIGFIELTTWNKTFLDGDSTPGILLYHIL